MVDQLTNQWFYDDVFAAAWMAKHFGMTYLDTETNPETPHKVTFALMLEGGDFDRPLSKYVVHPDNLHMLEPKEGDLVEFDGIIHGLVLGNKDSETAVQCDDIVYTPDTSECTVIQRNGKAFMWPEQTSEHRVDGK